MAAKVILGESQIYGRPAMRRMAVWIMLGALMGAILSLVTWAGEAVPQSPAPNLLPDADGPNCTALSLDRASGTTVAQSCSEGAARPLEARVQSALVVRI